MAKKKVSMSTKMARMITNFHGRNIKTGTKLPMMPKGMKKKR